ncbi:hypothetical protein GCM10023317_90290 [Actinopolymorpha pittospori]|uniref:Uncharacterized protein n=1 Tax=Actinopolymorpha pittospori TaxID=648752 RepID=A0A927N2V8_9ACTN|nr:hypothetical protein [Actinopolymorpha pittospori]
MFESGGGAFRVTWHYPGGDPNDVTSLSLWEYDPDNADDFVDNIRQIRNGTSVIFTDISYTVDGTNRKAELYFRGPCTDNFVHVDD